MAVFLFSSVLAIPKKSLDENTIALKDVEVSDTADIIEATVLPALIEAGREFHLSKKKHREYQKALQELEKVLGIDSDGRDKDGELELSPQVLEEMIKVLDARERGIPARFSLRQRGVETFDEFEEVRADSSALVEKVANVLQQLPETFYYTKLGLFELGGDDPFSLADHGLFWMQRVWKIS